MVTATAFWEFDKSPFHRGRPLNRGLTVTAFPYLYISFVWHKNVFFPFVSENLRARNRTEERSIGLN